MVSGSARATRWTRFVVTRITLSPFEARRRQSSCNLRAPRAMTSGARVIGTRIQAPGYSITRRNPRSLRQRKDGMHPLATLLAGTLHWISPAARAAVEALVAAGGLSGGADVFARRLRLPNRHFLRRILASDGLPPLQDLGAWIRLLSWVFEWEQHGTSLGRSALAQGLDPAVCYRLVKRVTGAGWREVRSRGIASLLLNLRDRCRVPLRTSEALHKPHLGVA